MFAFPKLDLTKPGLFIAGTDTDVGKTFVSCAIARAWKKQLQAAAETSPRKAKTQSDSTSGGGGRGGFRGLGVMKPLASDCTWTDGQWVNQDAKLLMDASGCLNPMADVNPVRFEKPLAPAVAAAETGQRVDWQAVADGLMRLDQKNDAVLVEGVGGLLAPLDASADPMDPAVTCLELIQWMGYPVVVVARSVLGTLNHTAMTVRLLKENGCRVAGVVMNGFDAGLATDDPSIVTNKQWIERMTGVPVLSVVPKVADDATGAAEQAVADVDWSALAGLVASV